MGLCRSVLTNGKRGVEILQRRFNQPYPNDPDIWITYLIGLWRMGTSEKKIIQIPQRQVFLTQIMYNLKMHCNK